MITNPNSQDLYDLYVECSGYSTDSRALEKGQMFIALHGERFDGNQFAKDADEKGAKYLIVDDASVIPEGDERYILVNDTTAAFQAIARTHRRQFDIPVIAIAGSNGKTTTKELIRVVLEKELNICITEANDNNYYGVPQTLLRLNKEHEATVIELGSNHPGELQPIIETCDPSHGLITNIGKEHLGFFGSLEGVLEEEGKLYKYLMEHGGKIFLPDNEPLLADLVGEYSAVRYGAQTGSDVPVTEIHDVDWHLNVGWRDFEIHTSLIGDYNLQNVAAAIAVGLELGIRPDRIVKGIESFKSDDKRSQLVHTDHNKVIFDCYNANPSSMALALQNFADIQTDMPKVVILGDMLEMGDHAAIEHAAVVELLKQLAFDQVYLVGPEFCAVDQDLYTCFENIDGLIQQLQEHPIRNTAVFLKASKGIMYKYDRWEEFNL